MASTPALFRLILQVPDLDQAADFYSKLLADEGRRIPGLHATISTADL